MFHSFFFQFPCKVEVLILLFTSFQFYSVVSRDNKVDNFASSLFCLLIFIRSGLLVVIWWSVYMLKSHWSLRVLFSRTGAGLCIYNFFVWSNLNFLRISQWITLTISLIFLLRQFAAFAYYMIDGFISVTA